MIPDFPSDAELSNATRRIGNDPAFARLEQEMATMRNTFGGLSDRISDAAGDIGSVAQVQARSGLKHARANVGSMLNDISDLLGVVADRTQSQDGTLGDSLENGTLRRPLATLALAVGLGFLAGAMWRR
jgi:hypothetical protein